MFLSHSKHLPYFSRNGYDGGGYPGMSIPTKKRSNPNKYGRILIADHESQRKIHSVCCITIDYL